MLIPFQGLLVNRAMNYAVVPAIAKTSNAVERWWTTMSPESRRNIYRGLIGLVWPIYSFIDLVRWALVRLYVIEGAAASAVWQHSRAVNSIVFSGHSEKFPNWMGKKQTRVYVFPLVLVFTPFFYLADITRSVAADKIRPGNEIVVEDHLNQVWSNTFASSLK